MFVPSHEFTIQVPQKEKRLYLEKDARCLYHEWRWPFLVGRYKAAGEFPVIVVRKHFIDRGYKVWVSGQSKIGIDAFILAMFPGARKRRENSYLTMVRAFGEEALEKFNVIADQEKVKAGRTRHGGDPDLFVQNSKRLTERFFVEVKLEDFTGERKYQDTLNKNQEIVFPLIEKHLKIQVWLAKVQIVADESKSI
jgi:hypothetical protein